MKDKSRANQPGFAFVFAGRCGELGLKGVADGILLTYGMGETRGGTTSTGRLGPRRGAASAAPWFSWLLARLKPCPFRTPNAHQVFH